tara:strand:- start:6567 stop:6905 length:339 start_codon:yes stop_codon:yes gene_type:complete
MDNCDNNLIQITNRIKIEMLNENIETIEIYDDILGIILNKHVDNTSNSYLKTMVNDYSVFKAIKLYQISYGNILEIEDDDVYNYNKLSKIILLNYLVKNWGFYGYLREKNLF